MQFVSDDSDTVAEAMSGENASFNAGRDTLSANRTSALTDLSLYKKAIQSR